MRCFPVIFGVLHRVVVILFGVHAKALCDEFHLNTFKMFNQTRNRWEKLSSNIPFNVYFKSFLRNFCRRERPIAQTRRILHFADAVLNKVVDEFRIGFAGLFHAEGDCHVRQGFRLGVLGGRSCQLFHNNVVCEDDLAVFHVLADFGEIIVQFHRYCVLTVA